MLPCTPQLPAQLYHPPLIQRPQNTNPRKQHNSKAGRSGTAGVNTELIPEAWKDGERAAGDMQASSGAARTHPARAAIPPQLAGPGMGEVTGVQAQQPAGVFSTSSYFPPSSCSPSQTGCFPSSAGRPGARNHTCSGGSSHCQPSPPAPTHKKSPG